MQDGALNPGLRMQNDSYDNDFALRRYERLAQSSPEIFENAPDCPITILRDPAEIRQAQEQVRAERKAAGFSTRDVRVGVLAEDLYLGCLIRDAVRFADGRPGLYNRVVATGGVVVLPLIGDGIALIRIFRHAARRWFLEAPQGFVPDGADVAEEARRELHEEIGATVTELIPLGVIYTSTAMTSEHLKMFAARISAVGAPQLSEGIEAVRLVPRDQIDRLLLDGTICDGPTTSLIQHCRLRRIL